MRRYVESAGRHFGVGGYVINTNDGDVFGEAWRASRDNQQQPPPSSSSSSSPSSSPLQDFTKWIRGEWQPAVFTNVKPTPIGTAYPEKAVVEKCIVWGEVDRRPMVWNDRSTNDDDFVMVRDDQEAAMLAAERKDILDRLLLEAAAADAGTKLDDNDNDNDNDTITICAWPER